MQLMISKVRAGTYGNAGERGDEPVQTEKVHGTMSTQTPKRGDSKRDELIAGEYVLGILSADDRRKVEARIVLDSGFAAIVNRWRSNLSSFDTIQEPIPPAPRPQSAIERRIFASPPPREKIGLWNSLPFWRTLAGLAMAGLAVIAILESARLAATPAAPASPTVTTGKSELPTGQ